MADTKISALPAVAVPAAGDEFACNQGGVTKKQTTTQILAAHIGVALLDHPNDSVTDAKLRNSAATSVIGRAGAGVGDPADIVAGVNDRVLAQAGGTLSFQQVSTAMIAPNAATDTIIRDSAARSVIGRAAAAGGDPADIVAGADNQVLARTGGTLAFQAVVPAMVTDRTRKFLCMAVGDVTAPATQSDLGVPLEDGVTDTGVAHWWVPSDFVSGMSIEALVAVPTTGTARIRLTINYEAIGEDIATHTDATGWINQPLVQGAAGPALRVALTQALSAEAIGDCLHFIFSRDGGDVGDVMTDYLYLVGFLVTYTADS